MLYDFFKRYLPESVKVRLKPLYCLIWSELPYLELHLTDHCNLNCRGCGHYSTVASPYYADIGQFGKDIRRLKELFRNIRIIRLLGGEPLLHKDPASFMRLSRESFPKSRLHFVTNGILLPKATERFWNGCRETDTTINLTVYPPYHEQLDGLIAFCETKQVDVIVGDYIETFAAWRNLNGDSDKEKAFKLCKTKQCTNLKDGHLYICPNSVYVCSFNDQFGFKIPEDGGIDIHLREATGRSILRQLKVPIESCRYCSYETAHFPWSAIDKERPAVSVDWDVAEQVKTVMSETGNNKSEL